jgi:glycosyltransferase involved in cell wall biosynthesis
VKSPLVSVLICSYNAERFIEATLRSVLDQTYRDLEVLVLDNCSSDGTVGILDRIGGEEPRLKLYRGKENVGAYGGLNYLLDRAAGKYIAIQDHDDIWHPDKVRQQVEFLEENSRYVGCGTAIVNYYERYDTFLLRKQMEVSSIAWHTSLVFRNYGKRYVASVKVATDFHFMKHVLCGGRKLIRNFGEPYVLRRIRADGSNLSTAWARLANAKDILQVDIALFDKLCLVNRLLMPGRLVDYLLVKLLLRRSIIGRQEMENDEILRAYVRPLS